MAINNNSKVISGVLYDEYDDNLLTSKYFNSVIVIDNEKNNRKKNSNLQKISLKLLNTMKTRNKNKNFKKERSYSKSKISETIHDRFGSNHVQQVNNTKNRANFDM